MTGAEEFKLIFGGVTLGRWWSYDCHQLCGNDHRKVKSYIVERHDAEQERDEKLAQALHKHCKTDRAQSLKSRG